MEQRESHGKKKALAMWILLALVLHLIPAIAQESTVIIVRHAEKDTMKNDPPLTVVGKERTKELGRVLAQTKIDAIYSTQFKRTRETVEPIAGERGLTIQIVRHELGMTVQGHVAVLVETLRKNVGKTVLVSSHSNVIPDLLRSWGIDDVQSIGDDVYDDLFIVSLTASQPAKLLWLKFGQPSKVTNKEK
jgi:phosphohistidine phosphatase SixA